MSVSAPAAPPPRRLFSRQEYHAMAENGILQPDERVELIEGEIIPMMPIGPWHGGLVGRLNKKLVQFYGDDALVFPQCSFAIGDYSEPEPDFMILRPRADDYLNELAQAEDLVLVIEVADSSLSRDKTIKLPLYARAGVREVWIVNRPDRQVEVYRTPKSGVFREALVFTAGEMVPLPQLDASIPVDLCAF